MTSPRTPRQWNAGDVMPEDRPDVVDERGVQWAWDCEEEAYVAYGRNEVCSWGKLLRLFGRLSEVLPETPEPPQAQGHRNGCPGCDHERGAYPPCWTVEQMDEESTRLLELIAASQSVPAVPAAEIIDEFVRVGWRPPLPEVMYDAGETAEEAVRRLAAEVVGLRQRLSSSLPDSETEWGWKPDPDEPDEVICATDEQAARERVSRASYRKLACREVGPWIEVTS